MSEVIADATPTFKVILPAPPSLVAFPGDMVEILADGVLVESQVLTAIDTTRRFALVTVTPAVADATYAFTARIRRNGSLSASSPALMVRIDTVAPAAPTLALHPADDKGGGVTVQPRPRFVVGLPPGIEAGDTAALFFDDLKDPGAILDPADVALGSVEIRAAAALPVGPHLVYARIADQAGNQGPASNVVAIELTAFASGVESLGAPAGDLTIATSLQGGVVSAAAPAADLTVKKPVRLAGAVASSSTPAAALIVATNVALDGAIASQSAPAGGLTVEKPLAAGVAADSMPAGDLHAAEQHQLEGGVASQSAPAGGLRVDKALAAALAAASTPGGALSAERALAGGVASGAAPAGGLTVEKPLASAVASDSAPAATLHVADQVALEGGVATASAAAGALTVERKLTSAIAAASAPAGALTLDKRLAAALAGSSALTATATAARALVAGIPSSAAPAADLTALPPPTIVPGSIANQTFVTTSNSPRTYFGDYAAGAGVNRVVLASFACVDADFNTGGGFDSVTWGGVDLHLIGRAFLNSSTDAELALYYLDEAEFPVDAHGAFAADSVGNEHYSLTLLTIQDAKPGGPEAAAFPTGGDVAALDTGLATLTPNALVLDFITMFNSIGNRAPSGAGHTLVQDYQGFNERILLGRMPYAPTGAQTLGWTFDAADIAGASVAFTKPGPVAVEAAIASSATPAGALTVAPVLAAAVASASSPAGILTVAHALAGAIASNAAPAGDLTVDSSVVQAARFPGSMVHFERASAPAGIADSAEGTLRFAFRKAGADGVRQTVLCVGTFDTDETSYGLLAEFDADNKLRVVAHQADGTEVFEILSDAAFTVAAGAHHAHLYWSGNAATLAVVQLATGTASAGVNTPGTAGAVALTGGKWQLGRQDDPANRNYLFASLGEVYVDDVAVTDPEVFYDAANDLVRRVNSSGAGLHLNRVFNHFHENATGNGDFTPFGMVSQGAAFGEYAAQLGGAPATITLTDQEYDSANSGIYTFTAADIGAEAADRLVAVCIYGRASYAGTPEATVTIGGNAATLVRFNAPANGIARAPVGIYILAAPTGTAADIVVTWNVTQTNCAITVHRITGIPSATAHDTDSNGESPIEVNLTVPTGGVALAAVATFANPVTSTWTGITEAADAQNYNAAQDVFAVGGDIALTCTLSASEINDAGVFASWAPAV